jgi:hypothetical protein
VPKTVPLESNKDNCHGQVHNNQAVVCRVVEMTNDVDALTSAIWILTDVLTIAVNDHLPYGS